jgi:hypothetical protein
VPERDVTENVYIFHQLEVIQAYPRLFSMEEGKRIVAPILLSEVLTILKCFVVSKIHGLDGWIVEFFLEFFNLLVCKLLEVVEESRLNGKINCLSMLPL